MAMSAGSAARNCGINSRIFFTTSMVLAPGWRRTHTDTARWVRYHSAVRISALESITLATSPSRNGAPVRLGDVAKVIDSSADIRTAEWYRTQRAVSVWVRRQPGANTIEVVKKIRELMPQFRAALPADIAMEVRHDRSQSIK